MTPTEFVEKWKSVDLKERTAAQSHFIDLCHLLGVEDPVTADPKGEWFTFEKGATKTSGGEGWADVWRKNCFAWEYKGKNKDLEKAFSQLQQYAIALENPPLLIVSDIDRIRLHTNWTNTVQRVHEFHLDDLIDAANRERLKAAFLDPEKLRPAKTRRFSPKKPPSNSSASPSGCASAAIRRQKSRTSLIDWCSACSPKTSACSQVRSSNGCCRTATTTRKISKDLPGHCSEP